MKDPGAVRRAVEGREWVFHLGALIAIPYSYHNPYDVVQTNVLGTAHVLDACRASSNSDAAGPDLDVRGLRHRPDRSHRRAAPASGPIAVRRDQDRGRCAGRELFPCVRLAGDDPAAVQHVRPAAVGPGDHPDDHQPGAGHGRAVKLGRLDPRRDLTYVKDTVAGFVAIAGCDAALGRAVNIGRGEDISIGDLVETIGRRLGRSITVETDQERYRPAASEVERLLAGTALAQSLWGWKPELLARGRARRDDRLGAATISTGSGSSRIPPDQPALPTRLAARYAE